MDTETGRPTIIRILIAAPYPMTRAGLSAVLQAEPDLDVAGTVADVTAIVSEVERLAPDVVVLDAGDGPDVILDELAQMAGSATLPPVLVLASGVDAVVEAIRSGAAGLLLRDATPEEISEAVRAAVAGLVVLDPRAAREMATAAPSRRESEEPATAEPLTNREREILQLIAQGLPNKAIATELGISEHTVKFHVGSILDKLGAASRAEALARATRLGLIVL